MKLNLTEQMKDILSEYTDEVMFAVTEVLADVAEDAAQELHRAGDFKNQSGKYRKGWSSEQEKHRTYTETTVYNKNQYMKTHLLEYGHAIRGGKRKKDTTQAFTHIATVNEKAQETAIRKIADAIERIK